MVKLDRICRDANVMLIFARSYGLTGLVRISVKVNLCFKDFFTTMEKFSFDNKCFTFSLCSFCF